MDIRNSVDGLRTLLGVPSAAAAQGPQATPGKSVSASVTNALPGDHATLSSAGTEAAHSAAGAGVRMEKVAAVQSAIAAGTYSVPASAVASRVVDAMLGGQASGH